MSLGSMYAKICRQVLTDPVNGNILWRKIEAMPEALGTRIIEGRGSRITVLLREVRRDFHRPHPGKGVLRYRVREAGAFHADTVAALMAAFEKTVDHYLGICADLGREPTKPYSGKFNVRLQPRPPGGGGSMNRFVSEALERSV